ncbi:FtsK/SpoIIIE domain-containing protein [Luedemannella flava]|uniref:FtsK/SpoIIIE domain-containing protein n=1 Tax=Luedemannella flava TaxID=349316 RepID=A0ABP4XKC5_9ACTN
MPLVNVIRGERIPDAPFNLRTPVLRLPLWVMLLGWTFRALARVTVFIVKHWYVTGPVAVVGWLYFKWGWAGPVVPVVVLGVAVGAWAYWHQPSFLRFAGWPVLARWRRVAYRRRWLPAMTTAGLDVRFDRQTVVPVLRRVRCRAGVDVLTVRMVTGQIPDDYAQVAERLAHTFGALVCRAAAGTRPDLVVLTMMRTDALVKPIGPLPVPGTPDFAGLPVALQEDGNVYHLRLYGTQVLVVGATGAGKGSVIWSIVRSLAGGVATGLVQIWAIDPKGGMELGGGTRLFTRFACTDFASMVEMLEEALSVAQARTARLRGKSRQHIPTPDEPLILIVIDELAALTAYLTDRQHKERVKATLGLLLTQGRAVGVHVVAALQDPRKEVLPFRNLFPTRIGLRMAEEGEVDMVLGDGMRDRGALCDRISELTPGVGFVVLDGVKQPVRLRFGFNSDSDISQLEAEYGRPQTPSGPTSGGWAA